MVESEALKRLSGILESAELVANRLPHVPAGKRGPEQADELRRSVTEARALAEVLRQAGIQGACQTEVLNQAQALHLSVTKALTDNLERPLTELCSEAEMLVELLNRELSE